jgi:O-antigen/teichoic acid export membrane protein
MSARRPPPPEDPEEAAIPDLRRRATGGAALLGGRAALVLVLGVGANVALARLLSPREFGVLALGTTFFVLGAALAEGGLGAALIRREEPPTRDELRAVNGLQIAATVALAAVVLAGAAPFGSDGLAVAAMAAALPIAVVRAPNVIVLERRLEYRAIALVDVVEAVVFYVAALSAVVAGMGVWGVAAATAVRAAIGTTLMLRLGPLGPIAPRWSWADVRPLIAFGAKMQATAVAGMLRLQILNGAIALIAGVAALGVWSLAWRILQIPQALFGAVARVAYPTLARTMTAGADVRPLLERATATLALANGAVLVAIAGLAPSLPALLGAGWHDVPETLAWSVAALAVGAPVWVLTTSYLFAAGDAGTVLRALLVHTVVWFGVALPLVDRLGVAIVGIGWLAAAAVTAALLTRRTFAATGARIAARAAAPIGIGVLAVAVAWGAASAGPATIPWGALAVAAGELVLLGGLAIVRRPLLREAWALLAETARRAPAQDGRASPLAGPPVEGGERGATVAP